MNRRSFVLVLLPALLGLAVACQPSSGAPAGDDGSTLAVGLRVKAELLAKLGTDSLRVDVDADGGEIRLSGEVKKRETAELAEEVAKSVDGVRSVDNRLRVATSGEESATDRALAEAEAELGDAALETRVRIALIDRMGRDGFRIGTDAASGVLTLEFPAGMERSRRREAVKIAEGLDGVAKVISVEKR